jgi:hypothetical protein
MPAQLALCHLVPIGSATTSHLQLASQDFATPPAHATCSQRGYYPMATSFPCNLPLGPLPLVPAQLASNEARYPTATLHPRLITLPPPDACATASLPCHHLMPMQLASNEARYPPLCHQHLSAQPASNEAHFCVPCHSTTFNTVYRRSMYITVAQKTAPMFAHFGKIGMV